MMGLARGADSALLVQRGLDRKVRAHIARYGMPCTPTKLANWSGFTDISRTCSELRLCSALPNFSGYSPCADPQLSQAQFWRLRCKAAGAELRRGHGPTCLIGDFVVAPDEK